MQGGHRHISNFTALDYNSPDNVPFRVSIRENITEFRFPLAAPCVSNVSSRYPEDWGWCFRKDDEFVSIARSFDRRLGYRDELGRLTLAEYRGDLFAEVQDVNLGLFGSNALHETYMS